MYEHRSVSLTNAHAFRSSLPVRTVALTLFSAQRRPMPKIRKNCCDEPRFREIISVEMRTTLNEEMRIFEILSK